MFQENLDRWVTVEQPTETQDAANQPVTAWTRLFKCPAKYRPFSTKDDIQSEIPFAQDIAEFTIRWTDKINAKMRLVFEGNYYYITGFPQEIGRRHMIKLRAQRGDHNGLQL